MHFEEVWYDCEFFFSSVYTCSGHLKTLIIDCQQDHFGFCYVQYKQKDWSVQGKESKFFPF